MSMLSIILTKLSKILDLIQLGMDRLRPQRRDISLWILLVFFIVFTLFFNQFLERSEIHLTILQTDMISMHLEDNPGTEMKKMKVLAQNIERVRKENRNQAGQTLLLDTGSAFYYEKYDGKRQRELARSVALIMHALDYDAMLLRGEDFLFGLDSIREVLKWTNVPILASGLGEQSLIPFKNFVIKRLGNIKVAIIGLSNPDPLESSHLQGAKDRLILLDQNIENNFRNSLLQVKEEGADIIIALSSLKDPEHEEAILSHFSSSLHLMVASCEISKKNDRCGKNLSVKGVPLIRIAHDQFQLGQMDIVLDYDSKKVLRYNWKKVIIDEKYNDKDTSSIKQQDLTTAARPFHYSSKIEYLIESEDERLETESDGDKSLTRSIAYVSDPDDKESPWGNYVCDSLLEKYQGQGIDIVLIDSEEILSPNKGPEDRQIGMNDLVRALPENSSLISLSLSGKEIRSLIQSKLFLSEDELGLSIWQMAGLRLIYDKKAKIKTLILSKTGKELEDQTLYDVLMTEKAGRAWPNRSFISLGGRLRSDILQHVRTEKELWTLVDDRIQLHLPNEEKIERELAKNKEKLDFHQVK